MKKVCYSFVFLLLLLSCKTTNPTAGLTSKVDRSTQSALKGNWKITKVTYPGSDYIQVISFQIADSKCFVGSTWNFIPNNNKGSMMLNASGCQAFSSPIVWSINKEGNFILKIVEPGLKSKKVIQGYILAIANQTESSFELIDTINVAGEEKKVVYQFEKI